MNLNTISLRLESMFLDCCLLQEYHCVKQFSLDLQINSVDEYITLREKYESEDLLLQLVFQRKNTNLQSV